MFHNAENIINSEFYIIIFPTLTLKHFK